MNNAHQAYPSLPQDGLADVRRGSNIRSYGVIKGIMGDRIVDTLPLRVRCECQIPMCEEIIEVNLAKRRELRRSYPRGFIVVPPHASTAPDSIVYSTEIYSVIEMAEFPQSVTDL